MRAAERQAEFEHWLEVNEQMLALAFVHEESFPLATRRTAAEPEPVDEHAAIKQHREEALADLKRWKRRERREARTHADKAAARSIAEEVNRRSAQSADEQASLDRLWQALLANERDVVFEAIEAAFEDNEMPAAPIDVTDAVATLVMRIGAPHELVAEREVTTTPTGKPTHKRRTKATVNHLYAEILASHTVASVKEALAVAPGLDQIRVLVFRGDRLGGGTQLIPLYAGAFAREELVRVAWKDVTVLGYIEAHGEIRYKGQAQELAPLMTRPDPELRIAVDELAAQLDWKPAP